MATNNALNLGLSGSTGTGAFVGSTAPTLSNVTIDNININTNTIISTNSNGNLNIIPNGSGITLCGDSAAISSGSSTLTRLQLARGGSQAIYTQGSYVNNASGSNISVVKSRSTTIGSFTTVQNSDTIGEFNTFADDGTALRSTGRIYWQVNGTVSTGIIPTQCILQTTNTAGTQTTAVTISNAQVVTLANALPVASGGTGITAFGTGVATALGQNVLGSGAIALETDTSYTPTILFGGGSTGITYSLQAGYYSKVGNVCTVSISIILTNKGSSTGNCQIILPINARATGSSQNVAFNGPQQITYTGTCLLLSIGSGSTIATLYQSATASNLTVLSDTNIANNSQFHACFSYLV